MSREKKLIKNTMIYAVGNFGAKFISFLLLPLYTAFLSKAEYGSFDMILTTVELLLPIFSLQIRDGMYRFLLSSNTDEERKTVFTNTFIIISSMMILSSMIASIVSIYFHFEFWFLILVFFNLYNLQAIISQAVRGLQLNTLFAAGSIILTTINVICDVIFLVAFKMSITGLLTSRIISFGFVIVVLVILSKAYKFLNFNKISIQTIKSLLVFSIPLIPNMISWWIMRASDRYILNYFIGIDANGVYAVSSRFPTIVITMTGIFNLAWQDSAILEYTAEDRDKYYSNVFNKMAIITISIIILLIPITKLVFKFLVAESFSDAYMYIPILYIGIIFSSFATFYGSGYLSAKKTFGAFTTSIYGAIAKILIALMLTPLLGIQAASISTMVAFLIMWIFRLFQTKKFFKIQIEYKNIIPLFVLCLLFTIFYYVNNFLIEIVLIIIAFIIFTVFNRKMLVNLIRGFRKKIAGIR